jgi:UDP-glucose 4-epimerase
MQEKILVTGGNGFIGRHLAPFLIDSNHTPVLAIRNSRNHNDIPPGIAIRHLDLSHTDNQDGRLFEDIDVVIHLAGIAHLDPAANAEYQKVNAEGTLNLARKARQHGVKRFIFISTVKVHGETTEPGYDTAITEHSPVNPADDYSRSKLDAEFLLKQTCAKGEMDYFILRVPLVFGPGVKANFYRLIDLVASNYPLPFSNTGNLRSFLYVENLCDLIVSIVNNPERRNRGYPVKDVDLSTTDLVKKIANALGREPRLFEVPPGIVRLLGKLSGQTGLVDKLYGSLVIDDSGLREELSWEPAIDVDTGIKKTVEWYRKVTR